MALSTRSARSILVAAVVLSASGALVLAPAASADPASESTMVIVDVAPGTDPKAITSKFDISTDLVWTEAANGFAANLTPSQIAKVKTDEDVLAISLDRVVARVPRTIARPAGRFFPGDPPASLPPQPSQNVAPEMRRTQVDRSVTADIDGHDDKRVDTDIAILDGGVDPYHPDLNVVGGFDCVRGPLSDRGYYDRDGHGTMVAGLAAAIDNKIGIVGAAPGARIWAVRVTTPDGLIHQSALLCGLEFANRSRTIDVLNLSLSGPGTVEPCLTTSDLSRRSLKARTARLSTAAPFDRVHQQVCKAVEKGKTVIAAAGNDSTDTKKVIPAGYDEVIAVSAFADYDGRRGGRAEIPGDICLDGFPDDRFASFSNFGRPVDVAAPGVCVISTFPGGQYAYWDGTSFSAPIVAGAAGLLAARYPGITPAQIRRTIVNKSDGQPIPGDPDRFHEGVLNASSF